MNCAEFRNLIHDLAREDAPADVALHDALSHADSCPACEALLKEAEHLTTSLRSLAAQHKSDAAPAQVETALLRAFRERHTPAPRLRKVAGRLAVSAVGLAAAALFAVLLTGYPDSISPESPRAPQAAPRETNRPSPRELWADYAVEGETPEEAAAAYIPLAAEFDPSWLEGGAIVRVVLSRPALESLGVPVNAGSDGWMLADMVVSNAGTPEAIRVVDWQVSDIQ